MLGDPITVQAMGETRDGGRRVVFWETRNAQGAPAVANGVLVFEA